MTQNRSSAVMAQRIEPPDSLDFFPTPPWATRALCEHPLCFNVTKTLAAWCPGAGEHHMARPLADYFKTVHTSDVFDYGMGDRVGSFVGTGADVITAPPGGVHWIIENPPFNLALEFAERGLDEALAGVALLVRSVWAEGGKRYGRLFKKRPPSTIAQFVERVPMVKGRWDPDATTATSYAWFIWDKGASRGDGTRFEWIPPGCRQRLSKQQDRIQFACAA